MRSLTSSALGCSSGGSSSGLAAAMMMVVVAATAAAPRAAAAAVGLVLGAEQVVEYVHDGGDVALGLAVAVLEGGVEGAGEGARVDAFAVVVHRLDDGALALCRGGGRLALTAVPAAPVALQNRKNAAFKKVTCERAESKICEFIFCFNQQHLFARALDSARHKAFFV